MLHINFRMCVFSRRLEGSLFSTLPPKGFVVLRLLVFLSWKNRSRKKVRFGRVDKVSRPIGVDNNVATFFFLPPFREIRKKKSMAL